MVVKCPCARRKYDTSAATRDINSCEIVVETSQLLRRRSKPRIVSGSYRVAMFTCPKALLLSGPSSESWGTPSLFASSHARVAVLTDVLSGLSNRAKPTVDVCTYRLIVPFTAVLPLPNKS